MKEEEENASSCIFVEESKTEEYVDITNAPEKLSKVKD